MFLCTLVGMFHYGLGVFVRVVISQTLYTSSKRAMQ